jgi:carbon-monoxide dehydrogenase medium subunit
METAELIYHRPATLAEAFELGRVHHDDGRYMAGGTELVVDLNQGRYPVRHLIALGDIPALDSIRLDGDCLAVGAMVRLEDIVRSDVVRGSYPALGEAVSAIGSLQIRNQGTIGGNFCGGVPCADAPPICIAGGAQLRIAGPEGERDLAAREFFFAPREIALEPGELLTEIRIPNQPESSGASYQRFSLRHGSALAVASAAARIVLQDDRIADALVVLGAVAPIPLPAVKCSGLLIGEQPSAELFERAARDAAAEAQPITDIRGSESFRRSLVEVLTIRALHKATERAGG